MLKKIIKVIVVIVLIVLFCSFLLKLINNNKIKKETTTNEKKVYKKSTEEKHNINEDIVGKIKISGTNIDDYVVKGEDNEYYLNHNIDKKEDVAGSVLLDYRNNFDDKKLLIYGHNARKLKTVPFHDLEKFLDKSFYDKYSYINLELNNIKSKWKIFSVIILNKGNNTHMQLNFSDESWLEHLKWLKNNSIYDTKENVTITDKILILQTCNYKPEGTYILICAKRVLKDE